MAALDNMMEKTGYNQPGLPSHQPILAVETQNIFWAAPSVRAKKWLCIGFIRLSG